MGSITVEELIRILSEANPKSPVEIAINQDGKSETIAYSDVFIGPVIYQEWRVLLHVSLPENLNITKNKTHGTSTGFKGKKSNWLFFE